MENKKIAKDDIWYLKQSPKLGAALQHFTLTCREKSVIDNKTRELIQMAVASVSRCAHCTESHLKKAIEAGATRQEVAEVLLIASMQRARTELSWHGEFFQAELG
ncbi:MAG: carboxymuconolactone decarboxylase family protein [Oligoflexia bacterium]|nr:carboxymuconolactone decarboxylase family protein [Oligoflexia bacterium]